MHTTEDSSGIGRWTDEEHERFLEAYKLHGRNWKLIQKYIGTRSAAQARSHAQKYFAKIERAKNLKSPRTQASTPLDSPVFTIATKQHNKPITPKKSEKSSSKRKLFYTVNQTIESAKNDTNNVADSNVKCKGKEENVVKEEENKEQWFSTGSAYFPELQSMNIGQFGSEHLVHTPWESELEGYQQYSDSFLYLEPRGVLFDREEDINSNDYDYPWRSQSLASIFE
jgi:SHAQKYF class myb-like DNA-binding protein